MNGIASVAANLMPGPRRRLRQNRPMVRRALSPQNLGYAQADKRLQILQLVGEQGSISQAARTAGISYKAAW